MLQSAPGPAADPAPAAGHTQVPNVVFDRLLAELSGAQLKVLLYIIRRTNGFHKTADRIALSQVVDGIVTRDGRRLDAGAGVARSTAIAALGALVEGGYILAAPDRSPGGQDRPTTYALGPRLLAAPPVPAAAPAPAPVPRPGPTPLPVRPPAPESRNPTPGHEGRGPDFGAAPVRKLDPQKKAAQNKVSDSNRRPPVDTVTPLHPIPPVNTATPLRPIPPVDTATPLHPILPVDTPTPLRPIPPAAYSAYIAGVTLDHSRELGDDLHGPANVTQALRLWQASGQREDEFVAVLHEARRRVRLYQGKQGPAGLGNKMAYFFRVVAQLCEAAPPAVGATGGLVGAAP